MTLDLCSILRPIRTVGSAIDKLLPASLKNAKAAAIGKAGSREKSSKK